MSTVAADVPRYGLTDEQQGAAGTRMIPPPAAATPTTYEEWEAAYALSPERAVGREGVAIDTLDDMQTLFQGIDVGEVSVSMTINAPAAIMLAFYVVAAETRGIGPRRLSGTIQADILKEYIGGMVEAVKQNFPQREIADASFELQTQIDDGERVVVGVNRFQTSGDAEIPTLRIDPALERKQLDRLQAVRARRDATAVARSLGTLRDGAARPDANLMPSLLECARARASEGEIIAALQDVWGAYRETPVY